MTTVTCPRFVAPRTRNLGLGGTRRGSLERFALLSMTSTLVFQAALHPAGPGNSAPVDVLTLVSIIATAMWATTTRLTLRAPYVVGAALMLIGGAVAGARGPLPGEALLTSCRTSSS